MPMVVSERVMGGQGGESGPAASALEACGPAEFVKGVGPHLRRLVMALDEDAASLFDSLFFVETAALLSGVPRPSEAAMPVGETQEGGWRDLGVTMLIAWVCDVAAIMATDRPKQRDPQTTASILSVVETVPALSFIMEKVRLSALPQAKKDAAMAFLLNDAGLRQVLSPVRIIAGRSAAQSAAS